MTDGVAVNVERIPNMFREGLRALGRELRRLAGDRLLSLQAFGGWLVNDPFYGDSPARSVAALREMDLTLLESLAADGPRLGQFSVAAPLVMTPAYIEDSRDVFPLELLEIQQRNEVLIGEDQFADVRLEPAAMRLQCERELKSELVQLRQGLLAAAGRGGMLDEVCQAVAGRTARVLRGVLYLHHPQRRCRTVLEMASEAADVVGKPLPTLIQVIKTQAAPGARAFRALYGEIEALAAHVDRHPGG